MTWSANGKGEYRRLFDLSDRVAVVTGGLGLLGRRFCAALADHGAHVAIVDQDITDTKSFADELVTTYGGRAAGFSADISDPEAIAPLASQIEAALGPIVILHNSAASKSRVLDRFFDSAETFEPEVWREIMATNLDGAFYVTREIGGRMARRRTGSIIHTSSIYGVAGPDPRIYEGSEYRGRPINTPAAYSASKAGVIGLTQYFATYWGDKGVRVNTLSPGGIADGQNEVFQSRYSARVPMGRMGAADEVTGALIFLASNASSYITGQNLIVDGGLTAW
ncbi:SDR family oxidoreductase (plasmid) [Pseudohalocynthiibacter aestuariivivens]|uniref:SDR family oxidoreductase n=1 Tax=Roseovarius pelagicus TaxID=2980108 RepID=A0ABY6D5K6_9RHOB|nr:MULTISPECIES: SDR family oxidoreductase [Rhodobacterales]QIE47828.1 SDR family oxidoreductase [Pseudohalocynthiibacter aestuariivivens]UXX81426.1 SDR family oxidoreductase [Roseovarius pelagicus]